MRLPVEMLVILCLAVGIAPQWVIGPVLALAVRPVVDGIMPAYSLAVWHGFNRPLVMSLLAMSGGVDSSVVAALLHKAERDRASARQALSDAAETLMDAPTIPPLVAAREAVRAIGPEIAIVDEAIATSSHVRRFLNSDSPNQYSFLRGGGLGWGMPAAVGCSLGLGRQPVVCLVGDGAALYSPQALWTAAHENLPITFIVMNNQEYNILKNFMRSQENYTSAQTGKFIAMDITNPVIDYQALALSMGVTACKVTQASDIAPTVEHCIQSGKTCLVEIVISA